MNSKTGIKNMAIEKFSADADLIDQVAKARKLPRQCVEEMFTYNVMTVNQVAALIGDSVSKVHSRLYRKKLTTLNLFPSYENFTEPSYRILILNDDKFSQVLEDSIVKK